MRRGVRMTASAITGFETRTSRASRGRSMTSDLLRPTLTLRTTDFMAVIGAGFAATSSARAAPRSSADTAAAVIATKKSLRENRSSILGTP